ncbi:sensor histidine kinase [Paracoccus sp. (in: a-proteobacteria)]|uniref:sensor histidine kinase n=1 Tax=Paracoccus sp. TaxID=267 RepID=UPI0026DEC6F5|nr:PAS domain-containing protein [Paracoccus sp. (in: a-proteobacteria)]MDO5646415.1 PAS domain-containing protein [Paracoccus sp. (in: a-proteobacteria)]
MIPSVDMDVQSYGCVMQDDTGLAQSLLDSSPDCIKVVNRAGEVVYMNRNGLRIMQIDDPANIIGQPWHSVWPRESAGQVRDAVAQALNGDVCRFEAFCPTAAGTPRWWSVTVAPVFAADGTVRVVLATSRDITEAVETRRLLEMRAVNMAAEVGRLDDTLEQKRILMGEMDHRVKNSLASVVALLRLQARFYADSPAADLLQAAARRVQTLGRVHDQLHLDPESGSVVLQDYIGVLVSDLADGAAGQITQSDMPDEPIRVKPTQAAALGQVLAELVANAIKHAGGDRAPRIAVGFTCGEDCTTLHLTVDDDGPGLAEGFDPGNGTGLGMQICAVYAEQLGGVMEHGPSPLGGARFAVSAMLEPV